MYHEKQIGRKCALHAMNNAMQQRMFGCVDMESAAAKIVNEIASRPRSKIDREKLYKEYVGQGGFYSLTLTIKLLNERGFDLILCKKIPRATEHGRYILIGESHGRPHSIAIARGYVIDSEEKSPIKLPATTYFKNTFAVSLIYSIEPKTKKDHPVAVVEVLD